LQLLRSPTRVIFLLVLLVLAPNLMWASRSSVLLHNAAAEPLAVRLVLIDEPEQVIDAGRLDPGERRFLWIAPRGEATLSVDVEAGIGWDRHCAAYVEEAMYRIEITIASAEDVACETSFPIFERLLVRDVLR
jgi:hypothetical protein